MMGLKVPGKTVLNDAVTGLVMAVINVPAGLANGVLAGVNPVFGLYSMIVGTTVAAFVTASVFMNVDSTSATALTAGEALAAVTSEEQLGYLVVLGLLIGLFMLTFGLLKLGFLVRFVSNAVMTGFLSGLGVLTVLGQVGDLTGFYSEAANKVFRTVDTFLHFGQVDPATLLIGLATIVTIALVERTPASRYAYVIALALVTVLVPMLGLESVTLVGDTTEIPRTIPLPHLPDLTLVPSLILPALAIALIALVQAAGVSQSVPNPDGEYPDPSGDFRGQGIANLAVGLSGGIPVGGSVSGTALVRSCGAQSRWANIFTGLFGLVVVLLFAPDRRAHSVGGPGRAAGDGRRRHGQPAPHEHGVEHGHGAHGHHGDHLCGYPLYAYPGSGHPGRCAAHPPLRLSFGREGARGAHRAPGGWHLCRRRGARGAAQP